VPFFDSEKVDILPAFRLKMRNAGKKTGLEDESISAKKKLMIR